MKRKKCAPRSPLLLLDLQGLGPVDPFELKVEEDPPGSGQHFVTRGGEVRAPVELAGLGLVGAAQALFLLSHRWLEDTGKLQDAPPPRPMGEVHLHLCRREARLLASLLKRHLARLPEPPDWMPELLHSLQEMDAFLRWEDH